MDAMRLSIIPRELIPFKYSRSAISKTVNEGIGLAAMRSPRMSGADLSREHVDPSIR